MVDTLGHKSAALGDMHKAHNWEYANATARNAATGFVSADVGKLARQTDDNTLWMLTATTPTWQKLTARVAADISDFDTQVRTNRLDQMAAPTGAVSMNSQKVTNLATPTENADAATKQYVDENAGGGGGDLTHLFSDPLYHTANDDQEVSLIGAGVGSITIPADTVVNGSALHFVCAGDYNSIASPGTITFRLKITAGTIHTLITSPAITIPASKTGYGWRFEVDGVVDGSTIAESWLAMHGHITVQSAAQDSIVIPVLSYGTTGIDFTVNQTFDFTAEMTTDQVVDNDFNSLITVFTLLNP